MVEEALSANTDLRVAGANLARARALLRETRAGRLPSTDLNADIRYAQDPGGDPALRYDAGLDVSYQLDLFGGIRRAIEASRADVGAVQAAFDNTRISVAAETVRAYADACSAGQQLAVARDSLSVQEQTFDLTRRLFEGGRGTALDTGQAGAQLEQVRATLPTLEAQRQGALFRLAVLTGRPPANFPAQVATCQRPPQLSRPLPVGDGGLASVAPAGHPPGRARAGRGHGPRRGGNGRPLPESDTRRFGWEQRDFSGRNPATAFASISAL